MVFLLGVWSDNLLHAHSRVCYTRLQNLIKNPPDVNTIVGFHGKRPPDKADAGFLYLLAPLDKHPPYTHTIFYPCRIHRNTSKGKVQRVFFLKLFIVLYKVISTPQFSVVTDSVCCGGLSAIQ
jgi:hypothetical protein